MSKFSPPILGRLRERQGLDPSDNSRDEQIEQLSPKEAFREIVAWEFGDQHWADTILWWAEGCGLSVQEQDNG